MKTYENVSCDSCEYCQEIVHSSGSGTCSYECIHVDSPDGNDLDIIDLNTSPKWCPLKKS